MRPSHHPTDGNHCVVIKAGQPLSGSIRIVGGDARFADALEKGERGGETAGRGGAGGFASPTVGIIQPQREPDEPEPFVSLPNISLGGGGHSDIETPVAMPRLPELAQPPIGYKKIEVLEAAVSRKGVAVQEAPVVPTRIEEVFTPPPSVIQRPRPTAKVVGRENSRVTDRGIQIMQNPQQPILGDFSLGGTLGDIAEGVIDYAVAGLPGLIYDKWLGGGPVMNVAAPMTQLPSQQVPAPIASPTRTTTMANGVIPHTGHPGAQQHKVVVTYDNQGNLIGAHEYHRRRRRALVTKAELSQLASLKAVLGNGEAFKTWIATRKT